MTAKLFTVPSPVAFNSRGLAVPGATATLYTTGTTTLQNFYSDSGLTVSLGSTITSDAIGRFPVAYQDAATAWRVIINDADGAQLADIDPFYFGANSLTTASVPIPALEDVATNTVLGRATAGTGPVEQITCTAFARSILDDADAATARTTLGITSSNVKLTESFVIACSNETTDLTTGTAKATFRMPYAFTLTEVRASVTTAPTGAALSVDINEGGVSVLSTVITVDAGEKTSTTAATAPVISDASIADDAEITIDIDQVGSTVAGAGLKVTLIGNRT